MSKENGAEKFTHEVLFYPAYDKRESEKGGGACGMKMVLALRGPKAVVTFQILTSWTPAPLTTPFDWNQAKPWPRDSHPGIDFGHPSPGPMGGGVSIHASERLQDWWIGPQDCNVTESGQCYGDTGYSIGDKVLEALVAEGDKGVWRELREIYDSWMSMVEVTP